MVEKDSQQLKNTIYLLKSIHCQCQYNWAFRIFDAIQNAENNALQEAGFNSKCTCTVHVQIEK